MNVDERIEVVEAIEAILPRCTRTLEAFFHETHGFGRVTSPNRPSPVSHAVCLEALAGLPRSRADLRAAWTPSQHAERMLRNCLNRPEGMRAYDLSFVLPALRLFGQEDLIPLDSLVPDAIATATIDFDEWVTQASDPRSQDDPHQAGPRAHNMFLYRIRRAIWWCLSLDILRSMIPADVRTNLEQIGSRLDSIILERFYYLIAMCSAVDSNETDGIQLGYALYSLRRYSSTLVNDVASEHAIHLVADSLVGEQTPPRLQNILRTSDTVVSVTPVQVLAILSELDLLQQRYSSMAPVFERTYQWVRSTERLGLIDSYERATPAWMQEPWRGSTEPEAWINAAVVEFLKNYAALLRMSIGRELAVEFGATVRRPSVEWSEALDYRGIKLELQQSLVDPIRARSSRENRPLESCSAILFGPPGTAKTTFAKALAWEIDWPFIEFKPHHFAMEGEDGVVRSIARIFRRLLMMRQCVIFFDEIDELVSAREEETKLGRFITTSVLPWLQELRDRGELVFIVATNHVERFDPAVKRPGRFDFVLPLGPPDGERRLSLLRSFLSDAIPDVTDDDIDRLTRAYASTSLERVAGDRITLGELRHLTLAFARSWTDASASVEPIMDQLCEQLKDRLLIDVEAMAEFEESQVLYRFPPATS